MIKRTAFLLLGALGFFLTGCTATPKGLGVTTNPTHNSPDDVDLNLCVFSKNQGVPGWTKSGRDQWAIDFIDANSERSPFFHSITHVGSLEDSRGCDLMVNLYGDGMRFGNNLNKAEVYSGFSKKSLLTVGARAFSWKAIWRSLGGDIYNAFRRGTPRYDQLVAERGTAAPAAGGDEAATGVSQANLKKMVQEAVTAATTRARIPSAEKSPVPSDIDLPLFSQKDQLLGERDVALVVGIEGYQDIPSSDFSASDARLVKDYLVSLGMPQRNIGLLLNERATASGMRKMLESWLPNVAKKDGRVFVYYSGHGAPDPATGEAYLVPHDGDPNYLEKTGFPLKDLYADLGNLQAADVLLVMDSCFSGAGGRSVLAKGARPLVAVKTPGIQPPRLTVLAATQGSQISTSSPEKGHGVFTYYFLKAIREGNRDVSEIFNFAKPRVEEEAKSLNVSQSPSLSFGSKDQTGRFKLRN